MIIRRQYSNVDCVFNENVTQNYDFCTMKELPNFLYFFPFKRSVLCVLLVFFAQFTRAQIASFDVSIPWLSPKYVPFNGESILIPSIDGQGYEQNKPHFLWKHKLGGTLDYAVLVSNLTFSSATQEDLTYLSKFQIEVPNSLDYSSKISISRGTRSISVSLFPFVKNNGVVQRVSAFKVDLQSINQTVKKKDFVASSVLGDASSKWYKISVTEDGIYKIDKAFLTSIGINVATLNPNQINIYGNGTGKLPEANSVPRPDDLVKNDILIVGESDGVFDDNDYILFHAWGPNRLKKTSANLFTREMNPYSTISCYFIRISDSDIPARISTIASESTFNTTVDSYNYSVSYEQELKSLVGGGQIWYGETFDDQLTRSFQFNVPNIIASEPAKFNVSIASNPRTSGNQAVFSIGSEVVSTNSIPSIYADYVRAEYAFTKTNPASNLPLTIDINRLSPAVVTYLDKIELNARRGLSFVGNYFYFRDLNSVSTGNVSAFNLQNFPNNGFVWDVTDRHRPKLVNGTKVGSVFQFNLKTDSLREFVASNGVAFSVPSFVEVVQPQNLHALEYADLLIVTNPAFSSEANRLADLHRSQNTLVHVVTTEQIFNEFSSGSMDVTAIKWFSKMFFDRANGNPDLMPKNMLLFGDGTYDPKNILSNSNFVPTYQVMNSENHIDALVTDDYFGMMDDNESLGNGDDMDLGIGRMLVSTPQNAKEQVDKVEIYMKNGSNLNSAALDCCSGTADTSGTFGDWRLNYVQIADDEEGGYFIREDCEPQFEHVTANHPEMNADKLYCDAFPQVSGAGGERYPEVFDAITSRVQRGALVVNYVGHGGESGAAQERIITIPQILSWTNLNKLNLFVSATCEFTKFDDPKRVSAGEWVALNPNGGAIALMTTTRSVYFDVNSTTGERFYENVFDRDAQAEPLTFGEIMRRTKNATNEGINKRSFTLIGDPALKIALPKLRIVTDSINHKSPNLVNDTIEALSKMNIKGHIEDHLGNVVTGFNGILSPTVFDKPKAGTTLAQNSTSPIIEFTTQRNAMYKGKATVKNGYFDFTFVVPKDINYSYGNGKISYYANTTETDASGEDKRFIVGGLNAAGLNDNVPPTVDLFLNDELFVSGGLTDENPKLIAKIFDENGINTVGNGIGHDIVVILDGNTSSPILLNDFYTADLDSYQSGRVEYDFSGLTPGRHTLSFKVWDVNNNSAEVKLDFIVQEKQEIALSHVLNYPNPFTTRTQFFFEHNQVCESLDAQIQIYTVSGKLVKTINQQVRTQGFRTEGIEWDGKDDFGDQIAKGVYVYRLSVRTPSGDIAQKLEKLVILR